MYVNSNETMGGLLTRGSEVVCGESCVCMCVCVCVCVCVSLTLDVMLNVEKIENGRSWREKKRERKKT